LSTPASLSSRFWATARTPRWIAALVLALGIAASFAALGQWQLERSVDNIEVVEIDTESAVPLPEIAQPDRGMTEAQAGRTVSVTGEFVPGEFLFLPGRSDGYGESDGTWAVGHLVTDEGVSLAVVIGTARTTSPPPPARLERAEWVGRYLPSEEPQSSDFEEGEFSAVSVPALINVWADAGPVYAGFLVLADPVEGYGPIRADAPEREVTLNWLNIFYAVEWVLFAGFAIYLWYRLVRDVVERAEEEEAATVD